MEIGQTDDFIPAFVIAHEWAHHVQDAVGLERVGPGDRPNSWKQVYSIELELMADCMSRRLGAGPRFARSAGDR